MSWALVQKELREHAWVALLASGLSGVTLIAITEQAADDGGRFLGFTRALTTLGTLNAIVAANRLFAREYGGRTQLFLEVLPLTRTRVFVTKWLVGAAWLALLTVSAFAYVLHRQRQLEVIALSEAVHVLAAGASFLGAVWSFGAMAGMLGRHRYTAWLALLALLSVAASAGNFALEDLPLTRLVDSRIAMVRDAVPWREHLEAWAIAAVCTAGAAALALVGQGALASALARKMTTRERVFLLCTGLLVLFVQMTLSDDREKPPFVLAEAVNVWSAHAEVGVMRTDEMDDARASQLAWQLSEDVRSLFDALEMPGRATLFVLPQHGFDRFVIERAVLDESQGVVLRAAADVPPDLLRANALHDVLLDHSHGRAAKEDRRVLLDGFTLWWVVQGDDAARERWWLRAAASRLPVDAQLLARWNTSARALGEHIAMAVAFAAVDTLAQRVGRARLLALMRPLLHPPPTDVRVLFETPPAALLERAGLDLSRLAQLTEAARRAHATSFADRLAQRPVLHASLGVKSDPARGTTIESALRGAPAYWVEYGALGPWERSERTARLDVRGGRATLPVSPRRGQRWLAAIEVEDAVLDCNVRVLARLLEVP